MTADRDFDDIIRSWLEPGSTTLSDRVRDAVLARSAALPQRRPWRPGWRSRDMNPMLKLLALALAVVLAVFAVGFPVRMALLGTGASPSLGLPAASVPSPETAPASPVVGYTWPGPLAAGTYSTRFMWNAPVRFSFTVPDGWESRDVEIVKNEGSPDELGLMFVPVGNVYADPCGHVLADPAIGPSVVDLTVALSHLPGIERRSGPTPVTFAGHHGEYLEFVVPESAGCPGRSFLLWDAVEGSVRPDATHTGATQFWSERASHRVWVLDLQGIRFLVDASSALDAAPGELAELQSVIDSVRIDRTTDPSALGRCTMRLTDPARPGDPLVEPYTVLMGPTWFEPRGPYPVDADGHPMTPAPPIAQIDWTGEGWTGGAGIAGPDGATGFTTHTGVNGPQGSLVFDLPGTWLVSFQDPDSLCFRQFTVEVRPPAE